MLVECIKNCTQGIPSPHLTVGMTYTVERMDSEHFYVHDDNGEVFGYYKDKFKMVGGLSFTDVMYYIQDGETYVNSGADWNVKSIKKENGAIILEFHEEIDNYYFDTDARFNLLIKEEIKEEEER